MSSAGAAAVFSVVVVFEFVAVLLSLPPHADRVAIMLTESRVQRNFLCNFFIVCVPPFHTIG